MYLFFDTETTGLPRNWKAPVSDTDNWPRMVQLAWLVYDSQGQRQAAQNFIIRSEGYTIPKAASDLHGITTAVATETGTDLQDVLTLFVDQVRAAECLVAHNMSFDERIVGAELIRKEMSSELFERERICTMQAATDFCALSGPYGYKWPKLSELYVKLFGESFDDAHDAAADVDATARCFWEMRALGLL